MAWALLVRGRQAGGGSENLTAARRVNRARGVDVEPSYFFFACFAARFSLSVLVGSFLVFFF